jgi:hypothetical protein
MKLRVATLLLAAPLLTAAPVLSHEKLAPSEMPEVFEIKAVMRDLWITHIFWVRNVVEARLAANADKSQASERQVLASAKAVARSIEPYYGRAGEEKLNALLGAHWQALNDYLDATRAADRSGQDKAAHLLDSNASDIAVFLGSVNPNLPRNAVRAMFALHGSQQLQQIRQLEAKQYDAEAETWTAMKEHAYAIAEALGGAIAVQFPDRFD